MENTQTLLERCQREAREKVSKNIYDTEMCVIPEDCIPDRLLPIIDEIIANTLKQAAEAVTKIVDGYLVAISTGEEDYTTQQLGEAINADAQKIINVDNAEGMGTHRVE